MSSRNAVLDLDLSGIQVRMAGPDDGVMEQFRAEWRSWLASPGREPDLIFEYSVSGEPPADQDTLRKVLHTDQRDGSVALTTGEGRVEIDRHGRASATVKGGGDRFRFFGLQNLLLAALARVLPSKGILVVHGAGIILEETAVALIGPENAGKTTWADIAREQGFRVLSDDLLFFGLDGGQPVALASPFRGSGGLPGRFPLGLLLVAEHAREAAILPCSRLVYQALLSANLPFCGDLVGRDPGLDLLLDRLLDTVQCRTLAFAPDPSFLPLLAASLTGRDRG